MIINHILNNLDIFFVFIVIYRCRLLFASFSSRQGTDDGTAGVVPVRAVFTSLSRHERNISTSCQRRQIFHNLFCHYFLNVIHIFSWLVHFYIKGVLNINNVYVGLQNITVRCPRIRSSISG